MIKVAWGMTAYGPIWQPVYQSHLRAMGYASRHLQVERLGDIAGAGCTDRMYTHSAENQLVEEFLNIPDATHLFFTEMDMILPDETIPRLLDVDKPIVSGVYFLRNGRGQPCIYKQLMTYRDNQYAMSPVSIFPTDTPFKADCFGLGCVLFRREVFEQMDPPWFDLKADHYGSDMYFYTKWKKMGGEVWGTPKVVPDQIDYTVVGYADYKERMEHDPSFAGSGVLIAPPEVIEK